MALFVLLFAVTGTAQAEVPPGFTAQSAYSAPSPSSVTPGQSSWGISAGVAYMDAVGNRGALWETTDPALDFKLRFRLSDTTELRPFFRYASFFYEQRNDATVDVSLVGYGIGLKWSPFQRWVVQPNLSLSAGHFFKNEHAASASSGKTDGEVGFSVGFGLDVPVIPGDSLLFIETQAYFIGFEDRFAPKILANGDHVSDQLGFIYSAAAGMTLLF